MLLQQNFSSCFRAHSEPRMPQSSEVTEHPSKAALMLAGYGAHHSTAVCLTDGCVLIPVMSALLEMNAIESVTMTKCTCVYPSVAKAESSIFCSLIFNTFKKMRLQQKNEGAAAFPGLEPSCFLPLWGPCWIQGGNTFSEDFAVQRPCSSEA